MLTENKTSRFANYLSWNSILSFSAINYTQAGLSFVISIGIAAYFGKEVFGYYSYGMIFLSSLITLGSFGTDKTLVRDFVQIDGNKEQFLFSNTLFKLLLGGIFALCVMVWAALGLDDGTKKVIVIAFSLAALATLASPKQWFDYIGKIHLNATLGVAERLLFLIGMVALVFIHTDNVVVWIAALFLSSKVLLSIIEWSVIFSGIKSGFHHLNSRFTEIVKNNSWIWFAAIGNLLMLQYNQIVLEDSYGLGQLAAFGLAFQLIQLIILLQGQILRLSTPEIASVTARGNKKEIAKELIKTTGYVLVGTLLLMLPFYLFAPYFVEHVIGKDFTDSIPVFNVLLIWVLIYGMAAINNQFLISLHLQKPYFVITMIFGLLSLFTAYYFVGQYGALGAALSLLIAHAGSIFAQMILVWSHLNKLDNSVTVANQ